MQKATQSLWVVFLLFTSVAHAMTGVEFLRVEGTSQEHNTLEPIVIEFVAQGYKNVPSWSRLGTTMAELIRKNGWATDDINKIALEAAESLGMTKK